MDEKRIQHAVREITDLDPSLKPHEAELRVFITNMADVRPHVPLDQHFVTSLRARLMLAPRPQVSPFMNLSAWAFRLAPLGAVALLLLMIAPPYYQTGQYEFPDPTADPRILEINVGSEVTQTARDARQSELMRYGMGGDTMIATEAESSMDFKGADADTAVDAYMGDGGGMNPYMPPTDDQGNAGGETDIAQMSVVPVEESGAENSLSSEPSRFLTVSPQKAGGIIIIDSVTAEVPGFIVIYENSETTYYVGTSGLVGPGTIRDVSIVLERPAPAGAIYYVRFYADNGDASLHTGNDTIERDLYGMVRGTPLLIE